MEVITDILSLREYLRKFHAAGNVIGLVPTMGNLHAGHLSLVNTALEHAEIVVATIFVNPLQFGKNEDLDSYPRTLDSDRQALEQAGCHCLFVPTVEELYQGSLDQQTLVHVPGITSDYCGASRPGHFDGVATVVCRLFNIVSPQQAFFGLKDYQQFLVIQKLTRDLAFDIEIVGVPTVREESGLALSSRNGYLDEVEKAEASQLYGILKMTGEQIQEGCRDYTALENQARDKLQQANLKPDYFDICDAHTLKAARSSTKEIVILGAVYIGATRLIDNLLLDLDPGVAS